DTYVDSAYMGVAVVGRVLAAAGYRVGIIAQPDISDGRDIARLGHPALFWGVTAGSVDSLVANYTATGKRRQKDDMTPGGANTRRPDRALIVYSNLIRRYFKPTAPIVLGGIEASLRRISHYDFWSNRVRRSVLFDAKADYLLYGMAEQSVLQLAARLKAGQTPDTIRGLCYIRRELPPPETDFPQPDIELAPHAALKDDDAEFSRMFRTFYRNSDPLTARRLIQRQDSRYLVQNPPPAALSSADLDRIYELPYAREVHPYYAKSGPVRALETIRFSLTTHRGCYGECRFCAISVHQGRRVISRSQASLLAEARRFSAHPAFKGVIADVGGPTANMYGFECRRKAEKGACPDKGCLFPKICTQLPVDHRPQMELLGALGRLPGVRKVFVASGLRYDLILADPHAGAAYLERLLKNHISGQLKIAPEHSEKTVLDLMGKPDAETLEAFLALFAKIKGKLSRPVFLTYYLMAAYPGCTRAHMRSLRAFALNTLRLLPEQVQVFTPTPATLASLMYLTQRDPLSGRKLFVEKNPGKKQQQKDLLQQRRPGRPRRRKP
ncbi:MAG: YgiQ family radical SAM protein, partial [Desulfobacterales bacterium]